MPLLVLLMSFLLLGAGNIEIGEKQPDPSEVFSSVLVKTGRRLQEVAKKRPLRVRAMNDSLAETAVAMKGMASGAQEGDIEASLDRAIKAYRENSFPYVLRGIIMDSRGNTAAANRAFEEFLLRSRAYTEFEKTFIGGDDFYKLRRVVYDLLVARGVDFKGRESQIRVRVPFDALLKYMMDPAPGDRVLNLGFIFILTGGTLFFLWGLRGADFSGYWLSTLLALYLASWCAYGCWIVDLAFGLPWGLNRFQTSAFLMGSVLAVRILAGLYQLWLFWLSPLPEGYRRCRKCRAVLPEVLLECPACGKRIKNNLMRK